MTKEQFLEKYGKPNTVVHCETRELAKEFLTLCEDFGIRWLSGDNALSSSDYWGVHENETCFDLGEGRFLTYGSKVLCEVDDYIIIPFKPEQKGDNK